jgi:hypothetical protein
MSNDCFEGINQDRKLKKEKRRIKNRSIFDKYEFKIIKEVNNIVTFMHDNSVFFFTEATATVREQGSKIKIPLKNFLKGEY